MKSHIALTMLLAASLFVSIPSANAACEGFLNAIDALEAKVKPADKQEAMIRTGMTTQPVAPVDVNGHYVRFFPARSSAPASTATSQTRR